MPTALWGAVAIAIAGACAIVAVALFGREGQTQTVITALLTFLGPTLAAVMALYKADQAVGKAQETVAVATATHEAVNGALGVMQTAARAAGADEAMKIVADERAAATQAAASPEPPADLPPWPGLKG